MGASSAPDKAPADVYLRTRSLGAVGVARAVECWDVTVRRRNLMARVVAAEGMCPNSIPAVVPFWADARTVF